MTDYEIGFANGETAAWKGRDKPLPMRPEKIHGELATGYWDARLPRSTTWARQQPTPALWSDERSRYVAKRDFIEYSRNVPWNSMEAA